jgi:hypothetical protein
MICNRPTNELTSEEFKIIEQRMYAGVYSASGFLAEDERLKDVIKKDNAYLESVGITHEQIADKIKMILDMHKEICFGTACGTGHCMNHLNNYSFLDNGLLVQYVSYMGGQSCPFHNKEYKTNSEGHTDVTITNKDTKITFNILLEHMIRYHQFFEGSVEHRLDPRKIIDMLDIKSGVSYKTPPSKYSWIGVNHKCVRDQNLLKMMSGSAALIYSN